MRSGTSYYRASRSGKLSVDGRSARRGCISASRRVGGQALARGFSLVEILVVIGIISLLVAIAVPAIGPSLNTSQQTQMIQQLTGAITIAQARAVHQGGYAIRIERAFVTNAQGFMLDAQGQPSLIYNAGTSSWVYNTMFRPNQAPVWLNYQQIRFLRPSRVGNFYEPTTDEVIRLPANVWLAPDYALMNSTPLPVGYTNPPFPFDLGYFNAAAAWKVSAAAPESTRLNPFDTFCIVFDQRGQVVELRTYGFAQGDRYQYQDQTQMLATGYQPQIPYPYNSARGVILYDRKRFEDLGTATDSNPLTNIKRAFLLREGRPFFVNRCLGSLVEGRMQ